MSRPTCSDSECTEPACMRFADADENASYLCVEHAVQAVRASHARRRLLDVQEHIAVPAGGLPKEAVDGDDKGKGGKGGKGETPRK